MNTDARTPDLDDFRVDAGLDRSLLTDALDAAVRSYAERLDYHLRAAWRAGYDYVYVYHPPPASVGTPDGPDDEAVFSVGLPFLLTTNTDSPPSFDGRAPATRYDVRDVDDADMKAAIRDDP